MQYLGSKNRISKHIVPIIQSYITADTIGYIEPFVGGANIIDKIYCSNKLGYDNHKELISLLNYVKNDGVLPTDITAEEYKCVKSDKEKYEDWYVGLVGFCGSYGAKYFGGYAKGNDNRNRQNEAIRNILSQKDKLKNITFKCMDFRDIKDINSHVIYCDPPYRNTTKYNTAVFPYEEFYDWCREMSKNNIVLVSEYNMPDDFECIWELQTKVNFDSNRNSNDCSNLRTEKLFILKK